MQVRVSAHHGVAEWAFGVYGSKLSLRAFLAQIMKKGS
jgi:hypothetical protein